MKSKWTLKQSTISGIILAIFFLIAIMLMCSILYMNSSIRAEQNAEKRRTEFKQLGIDLAEASDYLTEEARKFAVTRQIIHLEKYWEEINVARARDKVISRLQELNSPKEEMELLAQAKKYSDALVETERRSMRLVMEALVAKEAQMVPEIASFKLSEEDQKLSRNNKLLKAIEIMNDERYDNDKKNIMEPIAKFQNIMNSRLEFELAASRKDTSRATFLQVVLAFIIILAIAILIRILFTQVTYPIRNYTFMLKGFSFDNEGFRLTPQGTMELKMLAENFNDLYGSFHSELIRRKKAEETMKTARDEADYANKAKSEFLANMSHEIRTPLNSIIGYQYLLKNSGLFPKQNEYTENIGLAAKNLLKIINEILDISKIEAGRMILEEVFFNIDEVLNELKIIMDMEAKRKGIDIRIKVNKDVPKCLRGDITRFKQVILNLLSNGIKFTHKGYIFIQVELIEKDENYANIRFNITDTGIGINDDQKRLLFQVFTQGDASTSRKYGGTGLGLAICKRLVELMGGEISVESQVGKGSTFSFLLRFKIGDSIAQSNKEISQVDVAELFRGKRILLVEDSEVNLQMTREILDSMGIETDTAKSGLEAITKVGNNIYEAILMDIRMPEIDGYETTRQIRELEKGYVPIIALTADAVESVAQKAKEAGMNGYLTKPLEPLRLLEVLTGIVNNSSNKNGEKNKIYIENENVKRLDYVKNRDEVDFEGAIRRMGGKKEKYVSILKIFIDLHKDDGIKIKQLIESGNTYKLKEFVHSLKGSAANIGALGLKNFLSRFETDFIYENKEEVISLIAGFKIELQKVYEWAKQYVKSFDIAKTSCEENFKRVHVHKIIEDLEMLHKLLFMGDWEAKSLFEDKLAYLVKVIKIEDYDDLKTRISSYDFQEAEVIVDRIKQDIKESLYYNKNQWRNIYVQGVDC